MTIIHNKSAQIIKQQLILFFLWIKLKVNINKELNHQFHPTTKRIILSPKKDYLNSPKSIRNDTKQSPKY